MRWRAACAALGLALASSGSIARAHEPGMHGIGSRATAMGGAVSADDTDFTAGYYNPAGLAGEEGLRLGFGYFWVERRMLIDGRDSGLDGVHGLVFGLAATGKLGSIPVALGITSHLPDDGLSRIASLRQDVPRWELYDARASVLYLAANVAVRPLSWLELGGGMSFLAATRGRFSITGEADLVRPYDSQLEHEVEVDLTSVRYPQLGARVHLSEAARLALVYRGQAKLDLDLSGEIAGTLDAAGILVPIRYTLTSRTIAAFLPQQLVVGGSWLVGPRLRLDADVTWVNWSAYENPTARTRAKLEASPPPGLGVELPGEVRPAKVDPPGFSDRIVPRVGVEWFVPGLDEGEGAILRVPLRAGYVFERSPVPPQSGATNFVDADRHTVSFGVGAELVGPRLRLDAHAALSILPERVTEKASPVDLVGDYRQEGTMSNVGITLGGTFR